MAVALGCHYPRAEALIMTAHVALLFLSIMHAMSCAGAEHCIDKCLFTDQLAV